MSEIAGFVATLLLGGLIRDLSMPLWMMRKPKPAERDAARVILDGLYCRAKQAAKFAPDCYITAEQPIEINGRNYVVSLGEAPRMIDAGESEER